jgi:hypothetical protein
MYLTNTLTQVLSINITKFIFGQQNYEILNNTTTSNNTTLNNTVSSLTNAKVLKVYYPAGSYSPSKLPIGGIGLYSTNDNLKNATDVTLSYSVKFDKTFDPVLGGKLPGLYINKNGYKGGSGGKHTNNTSCRIAWRANFSAEAYVYLPKDTKQHDDYYTQDLIENKIYGDSLWRHQFQFHPTDWNNVTLHIRLNTFNQSTPNYDGVIRLTINNTTMEFSRLIWTTQVNYRIQTIIFETFFGGSSPKAATPHDTWSYFKDIKIDNIE